MLEQACNYYNETTSVVTEDVAEKPADVVNMFNGMCVWCSLIVSAQDSGLRGPGSSPGLGAARYCSARHLLGVTIQGIEE